MSWSSAFRDLCGNPLTGTVHQHTVEVVVLLLLGMHFLLLGGDKYLFIKFMFGASRMCFLGAQML